MISAKKFMPMIAKMYTIRTRSIPMFNMLKTESIVALNRTYRVLRFLKILNKRPIRMYLIATIADPSSLSPDILEAPAFMRLSTTIIRSNLFQLVL